MKRLLGRLLRLLNRDRIRLPRRTLQPHDIRPGDRLQIGQEIWRVGEARSSAGETGGRAFALIAELASAREALLVAKPSPVGDRLDGWALVRGEDRLEVPGEMVVHFPAGALAGRRRW